MAKKKSKTSIPTENNKKKVEVHVTNSKKLPLSTIILLSVIGIIIIVAAIFLTLKYTGHKVSVGDTVSVRYSGTLQNGTVFDTNIESIAQKEGLIRSSYELLTFTVGDGSMITGFDLGVRGMKKGETKQVYIPAAEAYGLYKAESVESVAKSEEAVVPRYITVEKSQIPTEVVVGDVLSGYHPLWNFSVTEINGTDVTITPKIQTGTEFNLPDKGIVLTVDSMNTTSIVFSQSWNVVEGQQVITKNGISKVKAVGKDYVTFDYNHPLAGIDLYFTVIVEDIIAK